MLFLVLAFLLWVAIEQNEMLYTAFFSKVGRLKIDYNVPEIRPTANLGAFKTT